MEERLPDNVYVEERGGYPYFIVTKRDGTSEGYWGRDEAIVIARLHQKGSDDPTRFL